MTARNVTRPRAFAVLASTIAVLALPGREVTAQARPDIVGAWEFSAGQAGGQRGLLIFTESHYSMMFARDTVPRPRYPDDRRMTDAETVAAYNSITANSGRYRLNGDSLTVTAYMANDPNFMGDWPNSDMTFVIRVQGDTLTWVNPDLIGLRQTVTLRRVR
jgi:hypothetical protein